MAHLELFSESRIQLQREVQQHPALCELVANHPVTEFETILAEIAAYCGIVLDGSYTKEDLDKLCDILYWRLRDARGAVSIVSTHESELTGVE